MLTAPGQSSSSGCSCSSLELTIPTLPTMPSKDMRDTLLMTFQPMMIRSKPFPLEIYYANE